jgi:hypothetical protein
MALPRIKPTTCAYDKLQHAEGSQRNSICRLLQCHPIAQISDSGAAYCHTHSPKPTASPGLQCSLSLLAVVVTTDTSCKTTKSVTVFRPNYMRHQSCSAACCTWCLQRTCNVCNVTQAGSNNMSLWVSFVIKPRP